MFHLKRKRRFPSTFPSCRLRSRTPLTFQFHLAWTHSEVRRTFSGASTCPGCTSPPPWMQWGLLILPQSAYAKRSFNLFLPSLAQRRGGLLLFLACTRSRARRTSFASKCTRALRDFYTTGASDCQKTMRSLKLLTIATDRRKTTGTSKLLTIATDRRKNDGNFKTFNYCHLSPKNDGDFKTFNYCHRSPKNDGDFKTFNYEACNITLLLP